MTPADLFATAFTALGLNPDKENQTAIGRPIKLADNGKVVRELFTGGRGGA